MAVCTFAVGTADTDVTPNTSGAFVPTANDLIVVLVGVSASLDTDPTLSSSIGGFTFSMFGMHSGSTSSMYGFVANALVSDTSSQTVTWTEASDPGTGSNIMVYLVSGMTRTGTAAVRQWNHVGGIASETPGVTFASACLTENPTIGAVFNLANPAGITEPTGWTEPAGGDIGYITPTTGTAVCHRDSGFTGTTITWGALSSTAWFLIACELNTSVVSTPIGRRIYVLP